MESEVGEQMYLLEIIVEDVHVSEEGILDNLRQQVEVAEQQLKSQNNDVKNDVQEVHAKNKVNSIDFANKQELHSDKPQALKKEKNPKQKPERTAPVKILAQFLDFEVLEIQGHEFGKYMDDDVQLGSKVSPNLQQGKSYLFSMSPREMMDAIRKHPIVIQVHREGSNYEPPHPIGMTRICLGQKFLDTIAQGNTPTIAVMTSQDDYEATNIFGDVTATVSLTIRLSCVGATITTQFSYNQFDGNFKFSSGEKVARDGAGYERTATGGRGVGFHKDDTLGIALGSTPECKLPSSAIPWRNMQDDSLDVRSCLPERLYKEQAKGCFVDNTFDLGEFNPGWTPSSAKVMRAKCLGGVCCGGMSAQPDFVPPEFGASLPAEIKKLLPSGKNPYEVPLLAHEQFASTIESRSKPFKSKGESSLKEIASCCAKTGQSRLGLTSGCPCMVSRTVYVCSNPKANQPPPLEEAGPHLKSSPSLKNETRSFKRDLQYVPCTNTPDAVNRENVSCGLEELVNQLNLKNLLQPTLMAPLCPPDSSGRQSSLCTCPKVPTFEYRPGGVVRCECTNILSAMKPIELPFTCPKPPDHQEAQPPMCPPCPPVPIKLPPPTPECPLAKLLEESENEKVPFQRCAKLRLATKETPQHATPTPTFKLGAALPDKVADNDKITAFPATDVAQKTGDSKPDHTSEKTSEKSKKAHEVLQDEVARSTTATTFSMETEMERPSSKSSKTASSSAASTDVPHPKKRKNRRKVDEGRGSGYTPTRVEEPREKELHIAYTPTAGKYPGFVIGHKNCIPIIPRVPKQMGWLWNIKSAEGLLKPGRGWRPGSIQTNVMRVMDNVNTTGKATNKAVKQPAVPVKTKSSEHNTRKVESTRQMRQKIGDTAMTVPSDMPPTLHIHKKHGLHYVSMIPPPKEKAWKKPKIKTGDAEDSSDSVDSLPAQFQINTKSPNGQLGDHLYETDDTTTISEDSYQMEVVAPSSLRHRQPQPVKTDMEVQVTETDFCRPAIDTKKQGQDDRNIARKRNKKKSSAESRKGKRSKRFFKNKA